MDAELHRGLFGLLADADRREGVRPETRDEARSMKA